MFDDFPMLAALNNARELVRPTAGGGRRGGLPAQVNSCTTDELQSFWNRYYKPRNAILALSGAVEPAAAREWITAHFAKLAFGEPIPAPREHGPAKLQEITEIKVRSRLPNAKSTACLAYAAPQCGSDLYAPFLVLIARLWAGASKLGDGGPTGSSVYFTPLDDGAVVALSTTAKSGETAAGASKRIEAFVAETIEPKLRATGLMMARQQIGPFLGLVDLPDNILTNNPYGVAFSLGRREQLNMSSAELKLAWDAVTDEQLREVAKRVFAPDRHAGAFIAVEK
jgi:zinc protease